MPYAYFEIYAGIIKHLIKQQEVTFRNKTKRTSEARLLSYSRIFLSLPGDKLNGKNGTLCPSVLNSTDRITLFAKNFERF